MEQLISSEQLESLKQSYMDPIRNHEQIKYCISQMKRFALCMKEKPLRKYQFFYQIGRIQELLQSIPKIWWNPFEQMIKCNEYDNIIEYTDLLREAISCEYDQYIIKKGCDN